MKRDIQKWNNNVSIVKYYEKKNRNQKSKKREKN